MGNETFLSLFPRSATVEQGEHTHMHRQKEKIIIDRLTLGEPEHGDERERTRRNKFEQVAGRFLHWELRCKRTS